MTGVDVPLARTCLLVLKTTSVAIRVKSTSVSFCCASRTAACVVRLVCVSALNIDPFSAFNINPGQRLKSEVSAASTPTAVRSSALLTHRFNLRLAFGVGFVSRQSGQQRQYALTTGILDQFH